MKRHWRSWPQRFIRWLFGSPFRKLPAPFGPTVPADFAGLRGRGTRSPTPRRAFHHRNPGDASCQNATRAVRFVVGTPIGTRMHGWITKSCLT